MTADSYEFWTGTDGARDYLLTRWTADGMLQLATRPVGSPHSWSPPATLSPAVSTTPLASGAAAK